MMSLRRVLTGAMVASLAVPLLTQAPKPRFEVASIKPRDSPVQGFARLVAERGTFSVPAITAVTLVGFAYDVRDDLIVGGPAWMRTDIFEVNARAEGDATRDEMRPMMQSLLEERFGLVIRHEQRAMPHFELRLARDDGRTGPNLQRTEDCRNRETPPAMPSVPEGAAISTGCGELAMLARMASRWMSTPVIDRTDVTGTFHYFLHTSPDGVPMMPGLPALGRPAVPVDPSLPTFRDALRDQLGLRLESVRGPVDVLAIDAIHPPTEN